MALSTLLLRESCSIGTACWAISLLSRPVTNRTDGGDVKITDAEPARIWHGGTSPSQLGPVDGG